MGQTETVGPNQMNVRFYVPMIQSRPTASVKSFGRRQASESPRGTNPRCAGRGLWGFDVLAVPGWAAVKCAGLQRMRIARAISRRSRPKSETIGWPFRRSRQGSARLTTRARRSGAQGVDGRSDWATAWRGNEPCRVTTAPRLLLERGAARAAASSVRRSR